MRVAVRDVVAAVPLAAGSGSRRYPPACAFSRDHPSHTSSTRDSRTKARAVGESGVSRKLNRDPIGDPEDPRAGRIIVIASKNDILKIREEIMINKIYATFSSLF